MRTLSHPSIIKLLDFIETKDVCNYRYIWSYNKSLTCLICVALFLGIGTHGWR